MHIIPLLYESTTAVYKLLVGREQLQDKHLLLEVVLQLLPDLCTHSSGLGSEQRESTVEELKASTIGLEGGGKEGEGGTEGGRERERERERE